MSLAPVDIYEVVKEVLAEAIIAYGPRFQVSGRAISGHWDRTALKRALENLIGNAVKYGRADTPITITIDEAHERLALSVHNEGDPIPPQDQECVFQMYRRTGNAKRNDAKGWGIGLPYVRAVAESHGSSVTIDSSAERGTTFVIDIPTDGRLRPSAPTLAGDTH